MTNFERIKNMNEMEMAEWLVYVGANTSMVGYRGIFPPEVKDKIYWLMSEVK